MKSIIDIHGILKMLPHRYPFLLIDRIIEMELGKSLVAIKNVSMNEPFFAGHFPVRPVMPGVLILEALAQAAGILAYKSVSTAQEGDLYYFAGIDHARFRRVVEPGDQLRLEITVLRARRDIWKIQGEAYVEGELACSAEQLLSIRKNERGEAGD